MYYGCGCADMGVKEDKKIEDYVIDICKGGSYG